MKVNIEVKQELIVNALESANIGYWAAVPKGADHEDLLAGIAQAVVVESEGSHDGSSNGRHTLTGAKVRKGLAVMAEKYPAHFAHLLGDDADAETGDVLVQCSIFGVIVYG